MPPARKETHLGAWGADGPAREPLSVEEVVRRAKRALDGTPELRGALVRGEISGLKEYPSGWYFTLKDEAAQLRAVMWEREAREVPFTPEDGMLVVAGGNVTVNPPRGEMRMVVDRLEPAGAGALAVALEQLKRKLAAEGLFDESRKRPVPAFARTVGVVTSAQGAVWHDIQKVALRRFPGAHLVLRPVKVQGEGAAAEIAAAIRLFNAHRAADVLIVGRGGGSIEDLWAFNEEVVVRAIAASGIPVVSAVGHETDFTLADLAADRRASTPSQAAEMVTPDAAAHLAGMAAAEGRLRGGLLRRAETERRRLDLLAGSPALARPDRWIGDARQRVDEAARAGGVAFRRSAEAARASLAERAGRLEALSPLATLARGYAVATRDGRALRRASDATVGDMIDVRLSKGRVVTRVTEVHE